MYWNGSPGPYACAKAVEDTLINVNDTSESTEALASYRYIEPVVLAMAGPMKDGARVLDIGCGGGYLVGRFSRMGCVAVGVDPNPDRLAVARASHPDARFEQMEARPDVLEQLGEQPFDLVVSTEVLEHLYAPEALARGAFRALRAGGHFILSTPFHGYLKNLAIAAAGRSESHYQPLYTGGHIKFFSRSSVFRLLGDAGFEQLEFRGAGRTAGMWKSMVIRGTRTGRGDT